MNTSGEEQFTNSMSVEQPQSHLVQGINESHSSNGDIAGGENLDRVREILFGSQIRNYEKRLNRLEERLVKECATLRDDTRKRLDSLETYIKREVDLLADRLKSERAERDKTVEELAQDFKDTIKSLEKKFAQLDEQVTQSERNLRQHTLEISKSWNDEIQQKSEEVLAVLEREAKEIRKDKANRSTLVTLLTEMAMRLNNELES